MTPSASFWSLPGISLVIALVTVLLNGLLAGCSTTPHRRIPSGSRIVLVAAFQDQVRIVDGNSRFGGASSLFSISGESPGFSILGLGEEFAEACASSFRTRGHLTDTANVSSSVFWAEVRNVQRSVADMGFGGGNDHSIKLALGHLIQRRELQVDPDDLIVVVGATERRSRVSVLSGKAAAVWLSAPSSEGSAWRATIHLSGLVVRASDLSIATFGDVETTIVLSPTGRSSASEPSSELLKSQLSGALAGVADSLVQKLE